MKVYMVEEALFLVSTVDIKTLCQFDRRDFENTGRT
jgi:hypothetical protein